MRRVLKSEAEKHDDTPDPVSKYLRRGIIWTLVGIVFALPVYYLKLEKELYILAGGLGIFGILQLISAAMIKQQQGARADW